MFSFYSAPRPQNPENLDLANLAGAMSQIREEVKYINLKNGKFNITCESSEKLTRYELAIKINIYYTKYRS